MKFKLTSIFLFIINLILILSFNWESGIVFISDTIIFTFLFFKLLDKFVKSNVNYYKNVFYLSSQIATSIGIILIFHHLNYYGSYFDIFDDDQFFYNTALLIKNDLSYFNFSGYEYLLGLKFYFYENVFSIKPTPVDGLILNWLVFGATIVLAIYVAEIFTNYKLPTILAFSILFGNYTITQNFVHLYRDVFIAFFTLLIFIFSLNKKWLLLTFAVVLITFFRPSNGFLAVIIAAIIIYNTTIKFEKKMAYTFIITCVLIGFFTIIFNYLYVSNFQMPLTSYYSYRLEKFSNASLDTSKGLSASIMQMAPIPRFLLSIPNQIFQPITIKQAFDNNFINHYYLGYNITVLLWIYIAPYLLLGIKNLIILHKTKNAKIIILTLLIVIGYLSFLSFQERHRTILIVLFPIIVSYSLKYNFNKKKMLFYHIYTIIFIVGINIIFTLVI